MNDREYIEAYILPYDIEENQIAYHKGEMDYDIEYVKEHRLQNDLYNIYPLSCDYEPNSKKSSL